MGQPTVVGEILGGVIAGPAVFGVYEVNAETELFAQIGVVLLLFQVGLETRLHDLLRVGRTALTVAILGVILPFASLLVRWVRVARGQRWSDGAWCRAARWASWSPGLGLSAGAIDSKIYSVVVGMAIITTLMVPPLLPMLVRRAERNAEPAGDDGPNL